MNLYDANLVDLEECEFLGTPALFTKYRITEASIPERLARYELRYGSDDSEPTTIENSVSDDYFGTIITSTSFKVPERGGLNLGLGDYDFYGNILSFDEFFEICEEELQ